jgi:hypothetical protein
LLFRSLGAFARDNLVFGAGSAALGLRGSLRSPQRRSLESGEAFTLGKRSLSIEMQIPRSRRHALEAPRDFGFGLNADDPFDFAAAF